MIIDYFNLKNSKILDKLEQKENRRLQEISPKLKRSL